jgi:hypothetical protein
MLVDRVIGVFKLDVDVFEEIEHDANATIEAAIIVTIVALVSAFGSAMWAVIGDDPIVGGFFSSLVSVFVGWLLWSAITFYVGTTLFNGVATLDEMLRVIGYAHAPQLLGIVPCIGPIVGGIWSLIAGFIAVRQGLDFDNTNAFLTIIVGFIVYVIARLILGLVFGAF